MGGILFKTNYHTKTDKTKFEEALNLMSHRGPDEEGILFSNEYSFGVRRLVINDKVNGHQPLSYMQNHLIFNGEIYNDKDLLNKLNVKPEGHSDTCVLLQTLVEKGIDSIKELNGMFSFVYTKKDEVYAVVDYIGSKPLYYTILDGDLLISSEIKSLLHLGVMPVLGLDELHELLAMSPSHSLGKTLYKQIYELKAGHILKFNKDAGMKIEKYTDVVRQKLNMTHQDMVDNLAYLLTKSVNSCLKTDRAIAGFLSGGLDSSAVIALARETLPSIDTFSIDYEGNKEEFLANQFEKTKDEDYIGYMHKIGGINHKTVTIDTKTLIDYLNCAVHLRDGPGMTDIDSSMLYLSKEVGKKHTVVLSGEGADELLGGYPWFNDLNFKGFPWIRNISFRKSLINKDIVNKIDLNSYLENRYIECIKDTPVLDTDTDDIKKELRMNYINIKYFMKTLLDRKDRMTMGASVEARMPFGDKDLVNFLYNVPLGDKMSNKIEKILLREAMKDILPIEILNRRKSPYPKSRSINYHNGIKKLLRDNLKEDEPIYKILDKKEIFNLLDNDIELETPWYGQLMRYDALLAWIYQTNYWLKEYKVRIEI